MLKISRLEGKHRALTQQHMDHGIASDCKHCPVAMVMSELVNDKADVEVDGSDYIRFYQKTYPHDDIGELLIAGNLSDWIWRFDRDMPVKPGVLFVFRQDDEDDENDDRLWVGITEGSPITYHPTPETMTAHVVFKDGNMATWEAHGGAGQIDYLEDNNGATYYTDESLKARGIRMFTLENLYEVEVD